MLLSRYFLSTYRKNPAPAETASHSLMLRSGMIRQLGSGIYTWLPIGLRVLQKMMHIVREEMNNAGAYEMSMPALQPADLWKASGRWNDYGAELMRLKDRHDREFCLGPTHEEVITDIARGTLQSYRQLPINLYQIQTKFRDEIRPRFGVMRSREFIMKDAYSFHTHKACLEETYQRMHDAYERIFTRAGLKFCAVTADSGNIGGATSHEFHVLADSGEDAIAISTNGKYAANVELAETNNTLINRPAPKEKMRAVDTGKRSSIEDVSKFLNINPKQAVKTLVVTGTDTPAVALVLRGDHQLNTVKAERLPAVAAPIKFVGDKTLRALNLVRGTIGPINLDIPVIADRSAAALGGFCCGANILEQHYLDVNWGRDCKEPEVADLRNVITGDPSPDGDGTLTVKRGIEVGHIFQLGQKYSLAMNLRLQDAHAKEQHLWMGCYGIGVGRAVAAAIEQNNDEYGIVFPQAIAPFDVIIVPVDMQKSAEVRSQSEKLYAQLREHGIDVLLDDREQRLGVKLGDAELLGIPHCVIISPRGLANQELEYRRRDTRTPHTIALHEAGAKLSTLCANG